MASVGAKVVLAWLKKNYGNEYTKQQIAEGADVSLPTVTGAINYLDHKRGFVDTRVEEVEIVKDNGKPAMKTVMFHRLNEGGLSYDPDAEEAAAAEKAAAEKAAKKAKKEAKVGE